MGNEVLHDRFGKGKVIELNGDYPNTKATVFFASAGQKTIVIEICQTSIGEKLIDITSNLLLLSEFSHLLYLCNQRLI